MQIGYYHLCGIDAAVLRGTDFEAFHDIFEGAWNRIANAIANAHRHDIGVLVGESLLHFQHGIVV